MAIDAHLQLLGQIKEMCEQAKQPADPYEKTKPGGTVEGQSLADLAAGAYSVRDKVCFIKERLPYLENLEGYGLMQAYRFKPEGPATTQGKEENVNWQDYKRHQAQQAQKVEEDRRVFEANLKNYEAQVAVVSRMALHGLVVRVCDKLGIRPLTPCSYGSPVDKARQAQQIAAGLLTVPESTRLTVLADLKMTNGEFHSLVWQSFNRMRAGEPVQPVSAGSEHVPASTETNAQRKEPNMIRKSIYTLGLLSAATFVIFGGRVFSYAQSAWNRTIGAVQTATIPAEFEFERIQKLIASLDREITDATRTIANQEVELARFQGNVDAQVAALAVEKTAIVNLREMLDKGLVSYNINGRGYTAAQLQTELSRRFNAYKLRDRGVSAKQESLQSQVDQLEAAKAKRDELTQAKEDLAAELSSLKAQHELVEARKVATKEYIGDSGKLSEIRKSLREMGDKLAVENRVVEMTPATATVPTEALSNSNVGEQIDEFFGKTTPTKGKQL